MAEKKTAEAAPKPLVIQSRWHREQRGFPGTVVRQFRIVEDGEELPEGAEVEGPAPKGARRVGWREILPTVPEEEIA